jgi:hypothetical protein
MGVAPDRSWRVGEFRSGSALRHSLAGWLLLERSQGEESVEDVLDRLFRRVRPLVDRGLPGGWGLEVACEILSQGKYPAFNLDADAIQFLATIGASLDVDLM